MGSGGSKTVMVPSSSQSEGSSKVEPWETVTPYIETLLPKLEKGFNVAPQLYQGPIGSGYVCSDRCG